MADLKTFAEQLVKGEKSVETASTLLPMKYKDKWVAVYDPDSRTMIGEVKFGGSKKYSSEEEFNADQDKHLVDQDSQFHINNYPKGRYGWEIVDSKTYDTPVPVKGNRSQSRFQTIAQPAMTADQRKAVMESPARLDRRNEIMIENNPRVYENLM